MSRISCNILRLVVVLLPIGIFGATYFLLGRWPNYLFGEIDTEGVYNLERQLFGVMMDGSVVTPCEYYRQNHWAWMDVLSGLLYLCWVPLPVFYAVWLQLKGHSSEAIRLTSAFLLVNLIGFAGYYIHPAAPPWYVMEYGFNAVVGTPGNVAGFEHFDDIVGYPLFHSIYGKNANVFAAIPSLHAAYNPVALYYAMKIRHNRPWQIVLAVVSVGIWFSAVYSGHHYIIDVSLGILTTIIGVCLFEFVILRLPAVSRFYAQLTAWLSR